MTEKWFMLLLLYFLPLLFQVWQRSGLCCYCYIFPLLFKVWQRSGSRCCYIVYHYCLRYYIGVVHVVVILSIITVEGMTGEWSMLLLLYCLPLLFKVWQRSGSCCCCYIFYHYCFRFDRGVVYVVVAILSTIIV